MKIKKYLNKILKSVKLDEMEVIPAHLAFYLIFILIPVVAFFSLIGNQYNIDISDKLTNNIPSAVLSLISTGNINNSGLSLIIFTVLSLLLASRGSYAIIISANLLFKVKDKDNLKNIFQSFLITLVLFLIIAFILMVPILGNLTINYLNSYFNETGNMIIQNIYYLIKYPLSLILMFLLIKMLYSMSLSIEVDSRYMNSGSIFTTIMWLLLSRVYSFYLNNFNHYNLYYGSMSNILILLIWVYLLAYIFIMGLALNADNYLMSKENKI